MKAYTFMPHELTAMANRTKEIFIDRMVKEGIIDEETADEMLIHSLVIMEKNMLGRVWDGLWDKGNNDAMKILVTKVLHEIPE